jgi:hypothetical protein
MTNLVAWQQLQIPQFPPVFRVLTRGTNSRWESCRYWWWLDAAGRELNASRPQQQTVATHLGPPSVPPRNALYGASLPIFSYLTNRL